MRFDRWRRECSRQRFRLAHLWPWLREPALIDGTRTRTGKLLWRFQTRAGVNAPPVVYEAGGKEYVVVAAGGNKLFNMPMGNAVIGFGSER